MYKSAENHIKLNTGLTNIDSETNIFFSFVVLACLFQMKRKDITHSKDNAIILYIIQTMS